MNTYRAAVFLLLLTFLFVEGRAQGFLRVSGTKILKGSGEEIMSGR